MFDKSGKVLYKGKQMIFGTYLVWESIFDLNDFLKQMEMLLYNSEDADVSTNAHIKNESLQVTQKALLEFLSVDKSKIIISRHSKNILVPVNWTRKWLQQKLQ